MSSYEALIISEVMYVGPSGLHPRTVQWIEVYNPGKVDINVRGWKFYLYRHASDAWRGHKWGRRVPITSAVATLEEDTIIPAEGCYLFTAWNARRYSKDMITEWTVLDPQWEYQVALKEDRNDILNETAFRIEIKDPNDNHIDVAGNLADGEIVWELPEAEIDSVRSSIIRRFDGTVARDGTLKRAWILARNTKRQPIPAQTYFGADTDLGTPILPPKSGLPVTLSGFYPVRTEKGVIITWETESELNNAGFNVLRSQTLTSGFKRINMRLIQGAGTSSEKHMYQFVDGSADPNIAYYYRIEDISLDGIRQTLATRQLRGVVSPTGKLKTTWGDVKNTRAFPIRK